MPKPDFPPLLGPGMHKVSLSGLHGLAVAPFAGDAARVDLYSKLQVWVGKVQASGLTGTLWLDGSFLTEKFGPSDIDCVFWNAAWVSPQAATSGNQAALSQLLDHTAAKAIYGLDLYLFDTDPGIDFHNAAYWRGVLGYCHDGKTAKGIAELAI